MKRLFSQAVETVSDAITQPWAFALAVVVYVGGFMLVRGADEAARQDFHLLIAGFTFLVVFLVQHAEKRHTDALQVKLNQLLDTVERGRAKIGIEELPGTDLDAIAKRERRERRATRADEVEALDGRVGRR